MEITVKIKIKDVTIELTRKEAEQLAQTLSELTGKEKEYITLPYPVYYHRWWQPVCFGTSEVTVEYQGNKEIIS